MNLGYAERYLMYINLPLGRIWQIVHHTHDMSNATLTEDLLGRFFKEAPTYPVARVRIKPGEAYLAPTENIVHDGSTEGSCHWDLYFTVISRFQLPEAIRA